MAYLINLDTQLTEQYRETINSDWQEQLQQTTSYLEDRVNVVRGIEGERVKTAELGSTEWQETNGRFDLVIDELDAAHWLDRTEFTRTISYKYDDPQLLGRLETPVHKTISALKYAAARATDRVVFGVKKAEDGKWVRGKGGLFGTNYVGKDGRTPLVIPASSYVPVDYVSSGTSKASGFGIDKLMYAKKLLEDDEAWNDEMSGQMELCVAVNPAMFLDLLKDPRMQQMQYGYKALEDGKITHVLGFRLVRTPLIPTIDDKLVAPVWVNKKVTLGIWEDASIEIKDQPAKRKTFTITCNMACGCAIEEPRAVKYINCTKPTK